MIRPGYCPSDRSTRHWHARGVGFAAASTGLAFALVFPVFAQEPVWTVAGGDARRGPALITAFGCANCHAVPGVKGADGNVGPPLTRFGSRTYVAGMLRNTPANLVRWLREPQSVIPGNAMPNMGITDAQARDIAAYLYTLQ